MSEEESEERRRRDGRRRRGAREKLTPAPARQEAGGQISHNKGRRWVEQGRQARRNNKKRPAAAARQRARGGSSRRNACRARTGGIISCYSLVHNIMYTTCLGSW